MIFARAIHDRSSPTTTRPAAVMRGLHGKQVMVMIDGIKVNDTMWRSLAYPRVIDYKLVFANSFRCGEPQERRKSS